MTPGQLSDAVLRDVRDAVADGELSLNGTALPERVPVRRPPRGDGDWATGIALRLAGPAGRPAPDVARLVGERLARRAGVRRVEVNGAGFLTVTLSDSAEGELVREILARPRPPAWPEDPARDVARWAEATGADPAPLLVQREGNPLFLVRYAHARSRALVRAGEALDLRAAPGPGRYPYPGERILLGLLGDACVAATSPARLRRTADALLAVECERPTLPRGDEKPGAVHRARLALAQAAGTVLAEGLHELGVSAPDHL